jgi:hypothetical protein
MIEVVCYSNDERVATAEAEDAEAAIVAARTLWKEASTQTQGQRRAIAFVVDGEVVRRMERRP